MRWTTHEYTECCLLANTRVYHAIPSMGEGDEGDHYDQTLYGYDSQKRRIRHVTPGGTITRQVLDARGNVAKTYIGTDDTGATASDPTGGGASGNNMLLVTANQYDSDSDGGDGNLTQQTQHVDGSTTRVTSFTFDWRNRQTDVDGEEDFYQITFFDNLDRAIKVDRHDTTSTGNLIARSETKYDARGRGYQSKRYAVDPSDGSVGNTLTDDTWYDESGNVIKHQPAGAKLFTKTIYDGAGRQTTQYQGYDVDETSYADASSVTGDTVLQQTETTMDDAGNATLTVLRQRYHNATGTGELGGPSSTQPKARVTYTATWQDALGREIAMANYGTNGGSTLTRPSTIPARSDDVLVNSRGYSSVGIVESETNPAGVKTCFEFDAAGRLVIKIFNCVDSSSSSSSLGLTESDDVNVTIEQAYNADGNLMSVTAKNALTGDQTTQYVYGTTLTDSAIASTLLLRKEIYPDSANADDAVFHEYNRQGEITENKDQNGTVHTIERDGLGRQTHDRVTDLGSDVDGAVRRISTEYEVRGMVEKIASYDNATVGSGSVVNQVEFAYNDFAQLTADYQAHGGAVNTSTTPKVQYDYADGSSNTIRPTSITYPDGRVITFDYGATDSASDALSRIEAIVDDDMSSTHLAEYEYLGLALFVEVDYTEPDIQYTLIGTAGGNDPDTGDIYRGLDRFGRIKDSYWYDSGASTDVDRIKYGYDRNSNRLWAENVVAASHSQDFDELYGHDLIDRLQTMERGALSAGKDSISNLQFAQDWALDAVGNWKNVAEDTDGNGSYDLNQQRTTNQVNEITDIAETTGPSWVTPAYSAAGNMTTIPQPADPTASFDGIYDAWNRLVRLEDGEDKVAEYEFDGARRRIVKKTYVGGVLDETRHLFYSEPSKWQVIEEQIDSSTDAQRQFVWGARYIDDLVLRDRDTTGNGALDERLYSLQDAIWNVRALTDATGAVQERFAFSAYGASITLTASFGSRSSSSFDWEIRFAGYRWDMESRFYMVRNRVFVPMTGWLQRDPMGYHDGVNLYVYAIGNPVVYVDPMGTEIVTVLTCIAAIGCLWGLSWLTAVCLRDWICGKGPFFGCVWGVVGALPPWVQWFCGISLAGCLILLVIPGL